MEGKQYSVDDILKEIKQKKQGKPQSETNTFSRSILNDIDDLSKNLPKSNSNDVNLKEPKQAENTAQKSIPKDQEQPENEHKSAFKGFDPEEFKSVFEYEEKADKRAKERGFFSKKSIKDELLDEIKEKPQTEEPIETTQPKENFVVSIDDSDEETINKNEPKDEEVHIDIDKHKKSRKFVLTGMDDESDLDDEEDDFEPQPEPIEQIDDFESYADAPSVLKDLKNIRAGLLMRFVVTSICGLLLLYMDVAVKFNLPFPKSLHPTTEPLIYTVITAILITLACVFCATIVFGGLFSAIRLKGDNDSLPAIAAVACLMQNIALIIKANYINNANITLFSAVAVFGLLFNVWGKLLIVQRMLKNFRFVSSTNEKFVIEHVINKHINRSLIPQAENCDPEVVCGRKCGFLSSFLEHSYSSDPSDNISKILAPLCLLGGIAVGVGCYFAYKSIFIAISGFTATICICAPFSTVLCANVPLAKLTNKLRKVGGMVSGYNTIEEFSDTNIVLVKERDLVAPSFAHLHGIKTFGGNRIDEAIIDAASLVCKADGTLSEVFLQVIEGRKDLLKQVESISFEHGMGIVADVNDREVLFGNRQLMQTKGVDVPSRDYEARYLRDYRNLLYLSSGGELTAMFVISYRSDEEVNYAVSCLEFCDVKIGVKTTDPNLTSEKLGEIFDVDASEFIILNTEVYNQFDKINKPCEKSPAMLGFVGTFESMVKSIVGIKRTKTTINLATIIQSIAVVLGYSIVAFVAIFSGISQLSVITLLGYQLFWLIASIVIPNMRKLYI